MNFKFLSTIDFIYTLWSEFIVTRGKFYARVELNYSLPILRVILIVFISSENTDKWHPTHYSCQATSKYFFSGRLDYAHDNKSCKNILILSITVYPCADFHAFSRVLVNAHY